MNEVEKKLLITLTDCATIVARYCGETGMTLNAAMSIVHSLAKHEINETEELPEDELSNH